MSEVQVSEHLETVSLYDLEGTVESAIERLQKLMQKYPGKTLTLDCQRESYGDEKEYRVIWRRAENEEEKKKRLEDEAETKAWRRRQFEAMKKEFEAESEQSEHE